MNTSFMANIHKTALLVSIRYIAKLVFFNYTYRYQISFILNVIYDEKI